MYDWKFWRSSGIVSGAANFTKNDSMVEGASALAIFLLEIQSNLEILKMLRSIIQQTSRFVEKWWNKLSMQRSVKGVTWLTVNNSSRFRPQILSVRDAWSLIDPKKCPAANPLKAYRSTINVRYFILYWQCFLGFCRYALADCAWRQLQNLHRDQVSTQLD